MRQVKRQAQKGFTLVELAVVIAIVAILAAVAIPRLLDTSDSAERAVAQDFQSQLISAATMYTAKQSRTPTGFDQFVSNAAIPAGSDFTISTSTLGPNAAASPCTVGANQIDCGAAFPNLTTVTYTWTDGTVTSNIAI